MTLFKNILYITLFITYLQANEINLKIESNQVENSSVVLITAFGKEKNNFKAILNDKEINFSKHPFKGDSFYALVPFHYFMEQKSHQVIVTYKIKQKDYFEGFDINLIKGLFDEEIIKVTNSKVSLSAKNKKRTSLEYTQAMDVYNSSTLKNHWYEDFIYPLNTAITSGFGTKRIYNDIVKSYHTGIDFKAKINTKVQASNSGIVKIASNRFYAGNSVIIDHGQGVYTCYFHLNKIFVSAGDFIQKGDIVGLSGNTGRSTGPHLHFATFVNGIQVNPVKLISLLNKLND